MTTLPNAFVFYYPTFAKEKVILKALLVEPKARWEKSLIPMAVQNLTAKHPELDIQVNYTVLPYNDAREQMLKALAIILI